MANTASHFTSRSAPKVKAGVNHFSIGLILSISLTIRPIPAVTPASKGRSATPRLHLPFRAFSRGISP
jgi:hypothetical protein